MITVYEPSKIDFGLTGLTIAADSTRDVYSINNFDFCRDRKNSTSLSVRKEQDDPLNLNSTALRMDINENILIDTIFLLNTTGIISSPGVFQNSPNSPVTTTSSSGNNFMIAYDSTPRPISELSIRLGIDPNLAIGESANISQIILTNKLGTFENQLEVSSIVNDFPRTLQRTASGKHRVILNTRELRYKLAKQAVVSQNDIQLQELIFDSRVPLLWSLDGFDQAPFARTGALKGYRSEDISLMMPSNNYSPQYHNSRWNQGAMIDIELVESV